MNKGVTIEQIAGAVNKLVCFVKPTYGPVGNKIIISNENGHKVLDDGFAIANEFHLEDETEEAIIRVVKEVSQKTNQRVGDGTTGSLIMLQALMNQKIDSKKDLLDGFKYVHDYLKSNAKILTTKEELQNVAQMAYNNSEIAEVIADLVFKLGHDGVITIEESQNLITKSEIVKGMQFDQGFVSSYMDSIFENTPILVTDKKISLFGQLIPVMEELIKENKKDLVIIADDIDNDALRSLVINKLNGRFNALVIKAPSFGQRKKKILEDIAIAVGAEVISEQKGMKLEGVNSGMLGFAKKVITTGDSTTIIEGNGKEEEVKTRVDLLNKEIETVESEFEKDELKKRIARLTHGVGVIKVGGSTESEIKAVKYKVEDAVNATKIAYKSGVVKGGGKTLSSITTSSQALNEALKAPEKTLIENGTVFSEEVYDPVEVLIASLESAISIALLLNSTKGVITKNYDTRLREV